MGRNWFRFNGAQQQSPGHSVLIVSDDSGVVALVGETLKERQCLVSVTSSVAETLQLLDATLPDVLICVPGGRAGKTHD